jgi:hypothetical protein
MWHQSFFDVENNWTNEDDQAGVISDSEAVLVGGKRKEPQER